MNLTNVLLLNLGLIAVIMLILWLISLLIRNSSIVDIFWGMGFVLIVWTTFAVARSMSSRSLLISVLTSVWGLRLAGYLAWRNLGKGEDYRYRAMREKFGDRFSLISLFVVFWLQGLIMWLVAFPIQVAHFETVPLRWLDAIGAVIWVVGWLFESVGDWQLARFKAEAANHGKVMDRGLWRYTRHPNYFGDFLVWWGFYVIALSAGGWWTIFSPILMTILLLRVSGVALLERSLTEKRPGYDAYVARTSAFFPWPPAENL
jgi:steroid 5-alpha reductase family enzyme